MNSENAISVWLSQRIGPAEKFKSMRQLSLAVGSNAGLISEIIATGTASAPTLVKLAEVLGESPLRLFVLAGWICEDEIKAGLSVQEEKLVGRFRQLPGARRTVLLEVLEAMLEPAS